MGKSVLTVKFEGMEDEILNNMVGSGMFATKTEALRSALVKYAIDTDLIKRKNLWEKIKSIPNRKVDDARLASDIEAAKNEA